MKIRTDYVTNSSSSSFILAFDNDRDYKDFCESCEWLDYEQLGDMVKNSILETSQPEQKDNARELLQRYFERTTLTSSSSEKFLSTSGNASLTPCASLEM